jgi:hypothetical protein
MIEQSRGEFEDVDPTADSPKTGNPAVDDALLGLADLASAPVEEHHDRLAQVHAALQEALDRPDEDQSHNAEPA